MSVNARALPVTRAGTTLTTTPAQSTQTPAKNASSNLIVRRFLFNKRTTVVAGTIIVVLVTGLLIYRYTSGDSPEYQTILPGDKSISELGGWKRISPPEKEPVFAYADRINDVPISVSQQPLPSSFRSDIPNRVADLAKKYNATTEIAVGNTTVYIGTSVKGPQSVIFTKKDLLILIKSQKKIENSAWGEYIQSLGGADGGGIPKY